MGMTTSNPCPFCGDAESGAVTPYFHAWYVVCKTCGSTGPEAQSKTEALEAWNTRESVDEELDDTLSALIEVKMLKTNAQAKLKHLRTENEALRAQVVALEFVVASQQGLGAAKEREARETQLNALMAKAEVWLAADSPGGNELRTRLAAVEAERDDLRAQLGHASGTIQGLMDALEGRARSIVDDLRVASERVTTLELEVSDLRTRLAKVGAERDEARRHHQDALAAVAHNIKRVGALEAENRSLFDEATSARVATAMLEETRAEQVSAIARAEKAEEALAVMGRDW